MYRTKDSFKKINEEIKIPFRLIEDDGTVLADFLEEKSHKLISTKISIPTENLTVETYEEYSSCIKLLKCFLEQILINTFKSKEEIIIDILKGREFSDDILKEVIKYKPFKLIVIHLKKKHLEVVDLIKNTYLKENSIVVIYDEYILVISENDIDKEIIEDLFECIKEKINKNVHITYCKINEYNELKKRFEYLKENINICLKYQLEPKVYGENYLLLERMINNSNNEEIIRIYEQYNNIFSKLDDELIKTIEIFYSEGLKIKESADKLYIHRNTLFYRIDKIKKIVNYNISNFNEALEFKILFLLWKEALNNTLI